jgi:penicillin-binding protein 1A
MAKKNPIKNVKKKTAAKKKSSPTKKTGTSKTQGISKKARRRMLIGTWVVIFCPFIFLGILMLTIPSEEIPDYALLENPISNQASVVYAADHQILGTYFVDNRSNVEYHELPENLINALVATEDERFFNHSGVDGWGLMRAVAGQATGQNKGGGSTITQQLAKMMFHEMPSRDKWGRVNEKLAEWVIAARIEKRYTKKEIIAMYFNQFDFLYNAVGIKSASRIYFNKKPMELTCNEAAILVGMAKSPVNYNPKMNPNDARDRRNTVLNQMRKNDFISDDKYDKFKEKPLELDYHPETQNSGVGAYFRAYVKKEIRRILKEDEVVDPAGNPYNVNRDGLKIYTSLDYNMQKHAEKAVEKHLSGYLQPEFAKDNKNKKHSPYGNETTREQRDNNIARAIKSSQRYKSMKKQGKTEAQIDKAFSTKRDMSVFDWNSPGNMKAVNMSPKDSLYHYKKVLKVGMISMDPKTGFVKAWVGGPSYKHFKYDYASKAKRQVGSTIKPFVYGAAIQHNVLTPCTTYPNIEYCIDVPNGSNVKSYCPKGNGFDQLPMPVYFGLASSLNPITTKVIKESGEDNQWVVDLFERMELANESVKPVSSLGFGVCDLSPLEITSAHCIFSNHGIYNKPLTILRIEARNGKVLYDAMPEIIEVMQANAAFDVLKMMKGALGVTNPYNGKRGGTARRLRSDANYGGFTNPIAAKTGTTDESADGWFIGHTPDLVTGIWVGNDDRIIHFENGSVGQGARMAMPIWGYYMKSIYKDGKIKISKGDFEPPTPGASTVIECQVEDPGW